MYVIGLIAQCSSVSKIAELAGKDALLNVMFRGIKITQSTLSRFLTASYNWSFFGQKRIERLQGEQDTRLQEGDSINLDDTQVVHPYGKKLSFLCWLYDHSLKIHVWGMNLVVLQAVLRNGIEYPLSYMIWRKPEVKGEGPTKYDLAREMLLQLRKFVTCRLWVAMDRWYLCKDFFNFLTDNSFDWVTKAKRNTALYRKEIESWSGRERYVPVSPLMIIKELFFQLTSQGKSGIASVSIPNIYIKMPYETINKKGRKVIKQRYTPIAAVVAIRLKEDQKEYEEKIIPDDPTTEQPAKYRGAYLIISNRFDVPKEALSVYVKRWRIEVFFRAAKQELGMNNCHSITEGHHHAHFELLFAAETLVSYAKWQANQGKTSVEEGFTHGEMVHSLFHTRCEVRLKTKKGIQQVCVNFDTTVRKFARLFNLFWPKEVRMFFGISFTASQTFPLCA
ncbi:Transposase DDE domain-containing protein [Desulfoscipio geothermicus DSM 3669]|uniref:Transposase DDE domain-containing protein n=1 Tax=Desulfoscipio geothermicus DSM 3669 TaxID=1121426 RepID=A0A1I6EIA6_9FIRM|nr:Transposase DDE domain-containing protein [Desulfoscipio geothermicus DSM 3669]